MKILFLIIFNKIGFRHPVSKLIHIRNLKRPFTTTTLQNMLSNFGKLDTDNFWIDKVKSNCIAKVCFLTIKIYIDLV